MSPEQAEVLAHQVKEAQAIHAAIVARAAEEVQVIRQAAQAAVKKAREPAMASAQHLRELEEAVVAKVGYTPHSAASGNSIVHFTPTREQCALVLKLLGTPNASLGGWHVWTCRACGGVGVGGLSCFDCGITYTTLDRQRAEAVFSRKNARDGS